MPEPVLVTGGSGFVGGALLERLVADGREVRALARSPEAAASVSARGAHAVPGDVLDLDALTEAMRGCDSVFHTAGVNEMCVRDPGPMLRTNVVGSGNVVRAAARTGVRRVVHTSSAAALGEARGTIGREDAPHRGSFLSRYERSKYLAERRVRSWAQALDVDVVCVNPSSVQGPGRTGGSARLVLDLVNGRLPILVDTTVSLVDIHDCTQGHLLAEVKGRTGERYVLNGATLSIRQALGLLAEVTGTVPRVRFAPRWVASGAGWTAEAIMRVTGAHLPFCRETMRTLLHGHRYDGARAERELGLRYTPIEESFRATLAWYAERGMAPPPLGARG
jgi:dihydroflavonol-4-reductase